MSPLFLLIFVFTFGMSLWATFRVKSTYARFSRVPAGSGYTGAEAAQAILDAAGIRDVEIEGHDGFLGDHYNPLTRKLLLSRGNYLGTSAAALGVAAHECGHAIQHAAAYAPLTWRMASVGVTNYANMLVTFLPLLGFFTGMLGNNMATYLMLMAGGWGIIMLFNLVTLPVEFDASRRAKVILGKMRLVTTPEAEEGVRKTLDAAAMTYVAAFLTSLLYFLWYVLPLVMGRRD